MKIDSLQVLHIKSVDHKGEEENPLRGFQAVMNPFPAMTCARHVYIFTSEFSGMPELEAYLSSHAEKSEWLTSRAAYEFLLRWAVGAESKKIQNNDHFVLGQVREAWDYFRPNNSDRNAELIHIMPMLFEDASNIRRLIQDRQFAKQNVKELLILMCENCANSRAKNQKPAYDLLLSDHQEYIDAAQREYLNQRLLAVSKSIRALNERASNELLPSKEKEFKAFRANLNLTLEKKFLQDAAAGLADPFVPKIHM